MISRNLKYLVLLLGSLTALHAQTPASRRADSLDCYTKSEMRVISTKLINGRECDSLYKQAKALIKSKDTTIASQGRTISDQNTLITEGTHLANEYKAQKDTAEKNLKRAKRGQKWLAVGWISTTMTLLFILLIQVIKS